MSALHVHAIQHCSYREAKANLEEVLARSSILSYDREGHSHECRGIQK